MATQKRTIRKIGTTSKRPSRTIANRKRSSGTLANFIVPLVFSAGILFCLGFLLFMGYRTGTAAAFFDVKTVDIRGINKIPKEDIEKIARASAEKLGVLNADLKEIKDGIEKFTLVKSVVVSRVLPDGIRVDVNERVPRAVVQLGSGNVWADDDAVILGAVEKNDERPPFALRGWNEDKTDKAIKNNQERVKIYMKMLDEWQNFELAKRVNSVDLTDLQEPQVVVQDSGEAVTIILSTENFGKRLQTGLEKIAGKGKEVKSLDLSSQKEKFEFRVN
ncbi:MAG TPA: FtsQ-type POTRA domain-containing protein [Pyrinomonadaceae bacterium]|nr:FtsQ-type POTRA domain-containing protein [Pyrinomonadaceae bacterium]